MEAVDKWIGYGIVLLAERSGGDVAGQDGD